MSFREGKVPGVQEPYLNNIRGCSIGCDGSVIDDNTCKPGGSQVIDCSYDEKTILQQII